MISATKMRLSWPLRVVALLMAVSILPKTAHCEFGSPFDLTEPTSVEADRLLAGHPACGALILYSIVAGQRPELLVENLETAELMADDLAADNHSYELIVEAFRVIALHLSERRDSTQLQAVAYGRLFCNNIELCANEAESSPACDSVRSAFEDFDY